MDPKKPRSQEFEMAERTEERLRREIEDLKRQLEQKSLVQGSSHATIHAGTGAKLWHPSSVGIWGLCLGLVVLGVLAFAACYIPLQKREAIIRGEALEQEQALPVVQVLEVHH